MLIYVVTTQSVEQTAAGVIERVDVRVRGVFQSATRAAEIAAKVDGTVATAMALDREESVVVQHWDNPGLAS